MELITTHISADFDSLASMVAAKKLYPDALLSFPGSIEQNVRDFLTLHKHFIEIKKPKEIHFNEINKLIIVDTRLSSRIGDFARVLSNNGIVIHVYDHHPLTKEDIQGEVNINEKAGATSTILVNIIRKRKIELTSLEATILALGIYEDTGSLTYGSTTPMDLEVCAYLLERGANLNLVSDFINPGLAPEQLKLLNLLLSDLRIVKISGIKIAITSAEVPSLSGSLSLVVHKLRDMENLNVIFATIKVGDRVQIIARSRLEDVDVGKILEHLGGGGHTRAASAAIYKEELKDVEERLLNVLKLKVKPSVLAKDIMAAPVRTIQETLSVEEARKIMLRFNFSALPILKGDKLVGIISRGDLDKAVQHGLKGVSVKGYMSSTPITIKSDTSIEEIQRLMIEQNIGHLPVVDSKNNLEGMVTRGDLLRILHNGSVMEQSFSLYSSPLVKKNVKSLIEKRLPQFLQRLLKKIGSVGKRLGYLTFVVGGFARDIILDIENFDIDIVVQGDGIKLGQELSKEMRGEVWTHQNFGTSIVFVKDLPPSWDVHIDAPLRIDIATARMEFYEYPAALPKVELSSIRQDLYRRDFTINAMAIRLDGKYFGELYDFFGGEKDLRESKIRVLHNLSFVDDPTRIFRAIRLSTRYNFKIENQTLSFIQNALNLALFDRLTNERIREELILILDEAEPINAIKQMERLKLLSVIHRRIKLTRELIRQFYYIGDIFSWSILYGERKIKRWLVYFLALVEGLIKKELEEVIDKFKFPVDVRKTILLVDKGPAILRALNKKRIKPSDIYKVLHPLPFEFLLFMMVKYRKTHIEKYIALYITKLSLVKLRINGDKLKELGFKPGPLFRNIFSSTLNMKLNGKIKDTLEDEIRYVKRNWKIGGNISE